MKQVISFLKSKISKNDKVIIACSSGSDSMGLLHLVIKNFDAKQIICAHVNHKVRKQSDVEYKYLENFCNEHKIIFEGLEIVTKIQHNFESEARNIRYAFFESLLNRYDAKYIITAHHGDDLIETILMRITRGSTLSGYSGIKFEEGKFLRPFLYVTKQDILTYVKDNNIKYFEDITNKQEFHTRNKYRKRILPFLKKENPGIHQKYLKFSKELLEYDKFITKYIIDNKLIDNNRLSTKKILNEELLIQRKAIELIIKNLQKEDLLEINDKNMEDMLNIIKSSKSNNIINLSNGYVARKSYDTFEIIKQVVNKDYKVLLEDGYESDDWIIKKENNLEDKNNYVIRLNSEEIKLPLYIRNRIDGDIIYLKNSGHKKIKDIFIDEKIDKNLRDTYPLVVDSNNEVLWIPGIKKSKFDKEKKEKYDIILSSERKLK